MRREAFRRALSDTLSGPKTPIRQRINEPDQRLTAGPLQYAIRVATWGVEATKFFASPFLTARRPISYLNLVSTHQRRVLKAVPPGAEIGSGQTVNKGSTNMAAVNFRPLHDRVVVRRVESEEKTAGGIIIPDTAKEKPQEGEIIAVGSGARDEAGKVVPLDVKAGDRVLFGKWSGTEVKLNGQDLLIMKESDIMGVVA